MTFPVGADEELEIALFYFDGAVEQIIASSFVTGSEVSTTSLVDVDLTIPEVAIEDAWVKKPIGILIRPSTADENDADGEGFWNVDFVRLEAEGIPVPAVSTWGLATTALLLVTMGTIALGRRETRVVV
jgi:hypothetical protein